jgi:LL-H family phage holin
MNEIIFQAVNLVVMIATLVVVRYIVPWIKDKIGAEALNTVAEWAKKAVLYAEQVMTAATGEEKKAAVTELLKEIVEANKISITDQQIDILIESAVKQMNMEESTITIEQTVEPAESEG